MQLRIYTVYDRVAKLYKEPFFMLNAGKALQGWETIVNDEKTEFNKFPDSYELVELGEYNQETGMIKNNEQIVRLATAKEYKRK